jgi:LPXTG-motif cell wall-anchored protein
LTPELKKRNNFGNYSYATPQGQKEASAYASGLKSKLLKINVIEFIQRNKTALGLGLLLLGGGLWYYLKIKKK